MHMHMHTRMLTHMHAHAHKHCLSTQALSKGIQEIHEKEKTIPHLFMHLVYREVGIDGCPHGRFLVIKPV